LAFDYRQAKLGADDRALCDYAIKLTLAPGKMSDRDVATLREHGFIDDQITIAGQVISYFNYITRIAQGLGVDRESWMDVPTDEWRKAKGTDYLASS
jgi:alkylhydroperoxidase family enzyme